MTEQIITEIKVDTSSFKNAAADINTLTIKIKDLQIGISNAKKRLNDNEKAYADLDRQRKEGLITEEQLLKKRSQLFKQITADSTKIAQYNVQLQNEKQERTALIKLMKSEENSRDKLRQKIAILTKEYNAVNTTSEDGQKRFQELQLELKDLNNQMNESSMAAGSYKDNIGNYTESIKKALKEIDTLKKKESELVVLQNSLNLKTDAGKHAFNNIQKEIESTKYEIVKYQKEIEGIDVSKLSVNKKDVGEYTDFVEILDEIPGAAGQASQGVKSFGASLKALLANPIVLLIAALVSALALLYKGFERSATGSRQLSKATAYLSGLMGAVTKIAEQLAQWFDKLFTDPQKAIEDLGKIILNNLINRFTALYYLVLNLGKAIGSLVSGDWDKLTQNVEDLGRAMVQFQTGLDPEQQKKIANELKIAADNAQKYADAMIKLNNAQFAAKQTARNLEKNIASLQIQFDALSARADDSTLSMLENRKAAIEAGQVAVKLAQNEEALAAKRLSIINQELNLRKSFGEDVQDLLDQQKDAEIAYTQSRAKNIETQRAIAQKQREIERDITEQRLDILIDGADKIKTVNEKIISDTNRSLTERAAKLKETEELLAGSYQAQLNEVSSYVNDYETLQSLVNEQDAIQLQKKIENLGANEIIGNRILEIVKERKQAIQDFADLEKQLELESIDRKKAATETIKETETEKTNFILEQELKKLQAVENSETEQLSIQQQIKDNLIKFEQEKTAILLENQNLLEIERQAIIAQSDLAILQLQSDFDLQKLENKTETDAKIIQATADNFSALAEITRNFAGEEAAIFGSIAANIIKSFEDGKLSAIETLQTLNGASNSVFTSIAQNRQADLEKVYSWAETNKEIYKDSAFAQTQIAKYVAEKEQETRLKQFRSDKVKALLDIAIQTATGISKAVAASPLTGGLPFSAVVASIGAIQAGIVASKKPNFGTGTNDIVNIGGSHKSGNDVSVFGFDKQGNKQFFGSVERGEAMPVIRKSAINDYQIAKLNGAFSGTGKQIFANGTNNIVPSTTANSGITLTDLQFVLSNLPPAVVRVEDITTAQTNKVQVRNNATI